MRNILFLLLTPFVAQANNLPDYIQKRVKNLNYKYITELNSSQFKKRIELSISRGHGALEFFRRYTYSMKPETVIYLTKKSLLDLDSWFIIDVPWKINALLADGGHKTMEVLIITPGKLIIGYDSPFTGIEEDLSIINNKVNYPKTIIIEIEGSNFIHKAKIEGSLGLDIQSIKDNGNEYIFKYGPFELEKSYNPLPLTKRKAKGQSPFSRSSFY